MCIFIIEWGFIRMLQGNHQRTKKRKKLDETTFCVCQESLWHNKVMIRNPGYPCL